MKTNYDSDDITWYHGSPEKIDYWTTDYVGQGTDQEGAGIYFTSDYEDAMGYARKSGNSGGHIYEVKLLTNNWLDTYVLPMRAELKKLIMWANNCEETLMSWGNEDVEENLEECLDTYCDLDTHFEAIKMIEADFYRDDGKNYCSSLVALDYDGVIIKKDFNNTFHAVIWNPKIIKSSCYAINESIEDEIYSLMRDTKSSLRKKYIACSSNDLTIKAAKEVAKQLKINYKDVLKNIKPDNNVSGSKTWNKYGEIMNLKESKSVGTLYHVTTSEGLLHILTNDILQSDSTIYKEVSFTRNKRMLGVSGMHDKIFTIRLVIDGDKLSEHYKIRQFCDSGPYVSSNRFEAEEQVIGPIKNIGKYIIEIQSTREENSIWHIKVTDQLKVILNKFKNKYKHIRIPFFNDDVDYSSIGKEVCGFYKNGKKIYSFDENNFIDIYLNKINPDKDEWEPQDIGYLESRGVHSLLECDLYDYDLVVTGGNNPYISVRAKEESDYKFLEKYGIKLEFFDYILYVPYSEEESDYSRVHESTKLKEKYETAKNEKFVKEILNNESLKKELGEEEDPNNILTILNKSFVGHDVYFSSDEIWGHYWTFGDVGIQLGCIYEDGSICVVCDPQYLIDNVFYEGSYKYYDFVSAISSIISHELIHLSQMDSTPYEYRITKEDLKKDRSNFDYLSNKKEIDAHAKEAVIELINIGYSKEKILSWLGNNKDLKTHAVDSTALWKYYDYFGSYMGHEDTDKSDILTWKRFLSRMHDFCVKE